MRAACRDMELLGAILSCRRSRDIERGPGRQGCLTHRGMRRVSSRLWQAFLLASHISCPGWHSTVGSCFAFHDVHHCGSIPRDPSVSTCRSEISVVVELHVEKKIHHKIHVMELRYSIGIDDLRLWLEPDACGNAARKPQSAQVFPTPSLPSMQSCTHMHDMLLLLLLAVW